MFPQMAAAGTDVEDGAPGRPVDERGEEVESRDSSGAVVHVQIRSFGELTRVSVLHVAQVVDISVMIDVFRHSSERTCCSPPPQGSSCRASEPSRVPVDRGEHAEESLARFTARPPPADATATLQSMPTRTAAP